MKRNCCCTPLGNSMTHGMWCNMIIFLKQKAAILLEHSKGREWPAQSTGWHFVKHYGPEQTRTEIAHQLLISAWASRDSGSMDEKPCPNWARASLEASVVGAPSKEQEGCRDDCEGGGRPWMACKPSQCPPRTLLSHVTRHECTHKPLHTCIIHGCCWLQQSGAKQRILWSAPNAQKRKGKSYPMPSTISPGNPRSRAGVSA